MQKNIVEVLVENDVFMVAKVETDNPLTVRFLNAGKDGIYRYDQLAEEIPVESINAYGDSETDFGYTCVGDGFICDDESDPDYEPETEPESESESESESEEDE